jgi:alkylhydroperoxidase family enzyme
MTVTIRRSTARDDAAWRCLSAAARLQCRRMDRHAEKTRRLADAVLNTPGHLSASVRHAIAARAAERADDVPAALAGYVDKVARYAYRVTPEDVAALRSAGLSEDAIFEATLSAALGAGMARLEAGLGALRGAS